MTREIASMSRSKPTDASPSAGAQQTFSSVVVTRLAVLVQVESHDVAGSLKGDVMDLSGRLEIRRSFLLE